MKHRVVNVSPVRSAQRIYDAVNVTCLDHGIDGDTASRIARMVMAALHAEGYVITKQVSP